MKKGSRKNLQGHSPEKFIEVWQTANTAAEAAKELGMKLKSAKLRAYTYRKKGIKLRTFGRPKTKRLDITALNKLIARLEKQHPTSVAA